MIVYADHAAATPVRAEALQAMLPYFTELYANPSSLHTDGLRARDALEEARETVARCLGCTPREIYFTSGGTESDNMAIRTAAYAGAERGRRHIVSTAFEHHAVLHTLEALESEGFEVTLLDVGPLGTVTPEQVKSAIRPDTALVTAMYANNEIGSVLPVGEIGAVCREAGVPFHTDAVQAAGHLAMDVSAEKIDLLSLSAHKFRGPRGVGALYVRRGLPVRRLLEGGGQERGRRPGTENLPGIAGMAKALSLACEEMEENARKVSELSRRLIAGLSRIPGSHLNGDPVNRLPGNVNFCFEGVEGESLLLLLDDLGIRASSGSACSAGSLEPSHVLLAIGRSRDLARSALRLSLGEENTREEVDYLVKSVTEVVEKLRKMG